MIGCRTDVPLQDEERQGGKKGRLLGMITLSDVLQYVIGEVELGESSPATGHETPKVPEEDGKKSDDQLDIVQEGVATDETPKAEEADEAAVNGKEA